MRESLLFPGTRVSVSGYQSAISGVVSGCAMYRNPDGMVVGYVVELNRPVWSEDKNLNLSLIVAHPDMVRKI